MPTEWKVRDHIRFQITMNLSILDYFLAKWFTSPNTFMTNNVNFSALRAFSVHKNFLIEKIFFNYSSFATSPLIDPSVK